MTFLCVRALSCCIALGAAGARRGVSITEEHDKQTDVSGRASAMFIKYSPNGKAPARQIRIQRASLGLNYLTNKAIF